MSTMDSPPDLSLFTEDELRQYEFLLSERKRFAAMTDEEARLEEYRINVQRDAAKFFREAWPILEPGTKLADSWHYDYIAEHLELVYRGELNRLIINVPPRTSKSGMVTISWPALCWARRPELRFLCASYSNDLSRDHSVKRRTLIESEWYRRTWPRVELSKDTNRQDQYRNTLEGEMIATSVGIGGTTGRGADILILDDGLSSDEAKSDLQRKAAHYWYVNTFTRRLNDPSKGAIVVVEQRTHDDDITGFLLREEPGQWTHIAIPLEEEKTRTYVYPVTKTIHERMVGDVLQPARFPDAVIASRKVHVRTYATQDQQKPAPDKGNIFQRGWWRYRKTPRSQYDQIITSWDFAVEGNADSDYNCGICLGKFGADIDVLDVFKERLEFTEQLKAFKSFIAKHPYATRHLVEKKANGAAIISSLRSVVGGVIAIEPQGSKIQRASAATPECESGNVYLIEDTPWMHDFVHSHAMFPNAANDDDVDAFSQAVNWLRGHNYQYGLIVWVKQQGQQGKDAMQRGTMVKPDRADQTLQCPNPKCRGTAVVRIGNSFRCNMCCHTWQAVESNEFDPKVFTRPTMTKRLE